MNNNYKDYYHSILCFLIGIKYLIWFCSTWNSVGLGKIFLVIKIEW